MAVPPPAVMAAAKAAPTIGSSFLTGAGSAIGSALGSFGSSSGKRERKSLKNQYVYRGRYMPDIIRKENAANAEMIGLQLQQYRDAGLHPLAALGSSLGTGASPASPSPMIPGQSTTGSFIGEGIRSGMQHRQAQANQAHAERIQALQLDEQGLRNDWLRSQIANSALKRAQILANANRGGPKITDGPGPSAPGTLNFGNPDLGLSMATGQTTSSQAAEDRYWEIGGAGMGLFNIGYDLAGAYLGGVDSEVARLEQAGVIPKPLTTGRPDPYRWRDSKIYGKYRLVRPPEKRPRRKPRRSYNFDFYNSP